MAQVMPLQKRGAQRHMGMNSDWQKALLMVLMNPQERLVKR
jgi:hypothetical protein